MTATDSFANLVGRLRAGDQDAATEIFNRYTHQLIALARNRLDSATRQKMDPEDVVLSAFNSFFARKDQFELVGWESLWGLLARITLRKCFHKMEYVHAKQRDPWREVRMPSASDSSDSWQAIARDPTPSESLLLQETIDEVMAQLEERERKIFGLILQGVQVPEISQKVGRTERTIRRVQEKVRSILEALRDTPM